MIKRESEVEREKREKNLSNSPFKEGKSLETSQANLNTSPTNKNMKDIRKSIENSRGAELPKKEKAAAGGGESCKCSVM